MIATVFRNDDLPPAERFEAWREMSDQASVPMEIRCDHKDDFRAAARTVVLDAVDVCYTSIPSVRAYRTPRHIRRSDPELYHLRLNVSGETELSQADRETRIGVRQFALFNTSRPYQGANTQGRVDAAVVRFPRALLPFPEARVDELAARRLDGREGIGALLADFLTRFVKDADSYPASDAPRLGTALFDLVTALLAHELEAESSVAPESRQRALNLHVRAFIQRHLGDPELSPAAVAAAHHISLRYLYRLFEPQEHTVAAWIRAQRLERCRADLADPAQRATAIQTIATRWGFTHPADFSRAFRTAYGVPPRDYRRATLSASACEQG
ncbi:helix-turn-helix domain-containing protein [Streptomyces montanus]|uniref:Helix-turn-helix domain-containing protein n=2 Tax=Streptomyces montanus TaxID=2580423 RepID=A0A5R9FLL7_9ACTN|nr:helix-turn-helix domain-containing protein [Streptomyces montanus]